MKNDQLKVKQPCPYCDGRGYFQLLLGGSETCEHCLGTGKSEVQ
ncbi:YuiA family protein [Pullulanibacillus camelliae]|nr:YuiA family protein [Pullulanibacillus camelliae]